MADPIPMSREFEQRPSVSAAIQLVEDEDKKVKEEALAAIEAAIKNQIETERLYRDQRYATAMNAVTQARMHNKRPAHIATPADAATVNLIYALLQNVAGEKSPPIDEIFSKIPEFTVNSALEMVIAMCVRPQEPGLSRNP